MSITSVVRLFSLVLAAAALLLGAGIGSASNEPAAAAVAKVKPTTVVQDIWDGRLCPREVRYGQFDQPITVQDI